MKERILDTAERLFYGAGIRATGVDTIAAEVGISKRTLYNHFPSKDALIAAYLKRGFLRAAAVGAAAGSNRSCRTFDRLEKGFAARDFRGCRFVNAVAELGEDDRAARKIAVDFKEGRRLWFRERLTAIGVQGRRRACDAACDAGRRRDCHGDGARRSVDGASGCERGAGAARRMPGSTLAMNFGSYAVKADGAAARA